MLIIRRFAGIEMFTFTKPVAIKGYSVVIPSLSVGNVPQLSVDLIIEALHMTKIGLAFHPAAVPVLGPAAFSHDDQDTTSCDLFVSEAKKLVAIQLRAPVAAKLLESFLNDLTKFLTEVEPSQVIILGSCFSHERHDPAMKRKLEYVGNRQFCEQYASELVDFVQHKDNKLPYQGFATRLYQTVESKLEAVPMGVLFAYVSEGDNVPDAKDLALFLNQVIGVFGSPANHSTLQIPMSWKLLFGNAGPAQLF